MKLSKNKILNGKLVVLLLLGALTAQAMEMSNSTLFSSKKEVQEEMGPEKMIVLRAQPELVRFLETGVMSAQAQAALEILAKDRANEGKSLERMAIDAIKANNRLLEKK
jgi:hypothetical protein